MAASGAMTNCFRMFIRLCLFAVASQGLADDATCSAAGVARAAFRDREAVRWISEENMKRAPYYIASAKRMYEKGVRQRKGIDKTNNDPFIALNDAQHQVLGALDLAPGNASIWLEAGQATAMIASLSEDGAALKKTALRMLVKACELDKSKLDEIQSWAKSKVAKEEQEFTKLKRSIGKTVATWKDSGIPVKSLKSLDDLLPVVMERHRSEVCMQGAAMPPAGAEEAVAADPTGQIKQAVESMAVRPIFPTLITSVNVAQHFGKSFAEKLATIAITKYRAFSDDRKRRGQTDPNDINDAFFNAQIRHWPELYNTAEYKQLKAFLHEALIAHATKTGYPLSASDLQATHVGMWAAVYLEDGGRHGYHVHQGSLSSCVFYAKAPPGKTPIMFVDPRGAPPTHDYEQHLGERDFEPVAPFHHNYHFFAEAGDLVCFPSWLVHRVPSHYEAQERVAFPANLQANEAWDAWYRSATLS